MTTLDGLDGSRFLIDPSSPDNALLLKFKQYPEFQQEFTIDKYCAIRYIILMYDIGNEEVQSLFPDYMTRKRNCAIMADFPVNKGRFSEDVEKALIGHDENFNKMIVRFVRMFNNPDYVAYISYWEMLIKNVELSISVTDPAVIQKVRDNISNIRTMISDVTKNIFRGDDSFGLTKQLYATMEEEKLKLRPELMAADILNNQVSFSEKADIFKVIVPRG
jgi:hypothetical protein